MGALYYYYKEHGICVICGSSDAMEGHTRCPECSFKEAEKQRIKRNTEEYKAKRRQNRRDEYRVRKAMGICIACGKPTADGHHKCPECLNKARKNKAKNKALKGYITREQKKALGICIRCTVNRALYGKTICQECHDLLSKQAYEKMHPANARSRALKKGEINGKE